MTTPHTKSESKTTHPRIRLVVADIDGCLSRGSTTPFSPVLLERLREVNTLSQSDANYPAITFCTGRPQPYVECLLQVTHGHHPALCENGGIIFDPVTHAVHITGHFTADDARRLDALRADVVAELLGENIVIEPGKCTILTVLAIAPARPQELLPAAQALAARHGDAFNVDATRLALHFVQRHIDKGSGLAWLSGMTGILPSEMAGIGDAQPDVAFLRNIGLPCCPANAEDDVKTVCQWRSERNDAEGTLDLLERIIAHNRSLPT